MAIVVGKDRLDVRARPLVALALGNKGWCVAVERRREAKVVDVFESPEVAAPDRTGVGAVVPVGPAEHVIGDLEITNSRMRLLGAIRGVRGILSGLVEATPEANGAERGHGGLL